jgi:carbamoyltransferase
MKLLSLSLDQHDDNISYFDGEILRYYKLERRIQKKQISYKDYLNGWKEDVSKIWGVEIQDIDKISITSCHIVPKDKGVDEIVRELEPDKMWYIDHHYAHALSVHAMSDEQPNVYITCDGSGDGKNLCVFKNDELVEYKTSNSFGFVMKRMGQFLGIDSSNKELIAGKLMSLQSYGNLNQKYYKYLQNYTIDDLNKLIDFEIWKEILQDDLVAEHTKLDWAKTSHMRMEELLLDFFSKHAKETDTIFYSGGCAQNIIWNTTLRKKFKNLVIPPHCGDEGLSLGGMKWLCKKFNISNQKIINYPYSQSDMAP